MKSKKQIEEVFYDKLRNLEVKVDPFLWDKVASRIISFGTPPTILSRKLRIIKAFFGISITIVFFAAYFFNADNSSSKIKKRRIVSENKKKTFTVGVEPVKLEKSLRGIKNKTKKTAKKDPDKHKLARDVEEVNKTEKKVIVVLEKETKKTEGIASETTTKKVPEKKEQIDFVEPEEEELEEEHYRIEVLPNVFTPNNDGNNDRLTINLKGLNNFNITVINMQNKVVYKSSDVSFKWDGLDLNNKPAPSGRYVYYITAQDKAGNPINKYSQLTLIR